MHGVGDRVVNRLSLPRRPADSAGNHARIDIATHGRCRATARDCQRQASIPAPDVQDIAAPQFTGQAEQKSPFEILGDLSKR